MCRVSATELKNNLSYYLKLSQNEDVYITKNDKVISILSNPNDKALHEFLDLRGKFGTVPSNVDLKELVGEEILKKCGF